MSVVAAGDRVRIHPQRRFKITATYPWLRQHSWFTVEAVQKRGCRFIVILKNPVGEERAPLWRMDVRKPRPGAEMKLAQEGT